MMQKSIDVVLCDVKLPDGSGIELVPKIKELHPDKFQEEDPKKAEAEKRSLEIIDAYHFLVSIAPETLEQNLEEYTETINTSMIADYHYKGLTLKLTIMNGQVI